MTTEKQIKKFSGYFRSELELLAELAGDPNDEDTGTPRRGRLRDHVRTLVATMLDGLASIRFPQSDYPDLNRRNRERFIRFIAEYGSWPDGVLVSVPVLALRLGQSNRTGRLIDHLSSILSRYTTDQPNSLPLTAFDQPIPDLLELAESEREEEQIERAQHLSLLYSYRNFLLHEFRSPGYGMGAMCEDPTQPCYHGFIGEPEWRLAYPAGFFLRLAESAISNLESFLKSGPHNPYDRFESSDQW